MTGHAYDAVVFDLDGTVIDSTAGIVASFEAAYAEMAMVYPGEDAIVRTISVPLEDQLALLGVADVDAFVHVYRRHYAAIAPAHTSLFPGAAELLRALHDARVPLGVATSKSRPSAESLLGHLGVYDLLDVCIGREDVTHPKPHPEALLRAAAGLGVAPERMVYVGDSRFDVEAARRAGAWCLAVATGAAGAAPLVELGVESVLDDLHAVRERLGFSRAVDTFIE